MKRRAAFSVLTVAVLLAAVGGGPDPAGERAPAAAPVTPIVSAVPAGHDDDFRELAGLRRAARAAARSAAPAAAPAAGPAAAARVKAAAPKVRAGRPKVNRPVPKAPVPAVPRRAHRAPVGPGVAAPGSAARAVPGGGGRAGAVIAFALAQRGKPYVMGAAGPGAYDCSGLLMAAFARVGVRLPHKADQIPGVGRPVPRERWQPGDVLHWQGHVALYLGNGQIVSASRRGVPVRVAPVWGSPTGWRLL